MAKRMRVSRSNAGGANASNGGILGSGIFGHFGTIVNCNAEDDSLYCNFMKFINVLFMVIFLIAVIYLAYSYVLVPFLKTKRQR